MLGQAVQSSADLNAVLLAAKDKDVVFFDECHELPKEQQTALYLAIDQRQIILQGGRSGRMPQSIPLANFTLLLASTDEFSLLQPLRDRMKLVLRFQFYYADELATWSSQRSQALRLESRGGGLSARSLNALVGRPGWRCGCFSRAEVSAERKAIQRSPRTIWNVPVCWSRSTPWAWGRPSSST